MDFIEKLANGELTQDDFGVIAGYDHIKEKGEEDEETLEPSADEPTT